MGGVSGPRGASEEPREGQRAGVQRGKKVDTVTVCPLTFNQLHVFIPFLSITGCHTAPQKGGMEVLAGLLSMEQHCQGKRGHPAGQNVSVSVTQHLLLTLLDG